ncbi:MAG TPA: hypothetical protein VHZ02_14725 [Acidimicrobiales bacterium]|nr:hypothetical protein [Acidimicrobiales bacterium]
MSDNQADGVDGSGGPGPDDALPPAEAPPAEAELLDAFSRLAPAGSHRWNFEESMSRLNPQPPPDPPSAVPPWRGLPPDVWAHGRSAQVGQRMVGDVLAAVSDLLAADSRMAATEVARAQTLASRRQLAAAWDALRFLAARLERLERRNDVVTDLFPDLSGDVPEADVGPWADRLSSWFIPPEVEGPVVHGESGDGSLLRSLAAAGYQATGIEPRAARVWEDTGEDDTGNEVALGEVADRLTDRADGELAGLVLSGCVDRLDLPAKLLLIELAMNKTAPGATVAVLATDQRAWSDASPVPTLDLVPGRPLHPETWTAVFDRVGLVDVHWHPPEGEELTHAIVGRRR